MKPEVLQNIVLGIYFNTHLTVALRDAPDWQRVLSLSERALNVLPASWLDDGADGRSPARWVRADSWIFSCE